MTALVGLLIVAQVEHVMQARAGLNTMVPAARLTKDPAGHAMTGQAVLHMMAPVDLHIPGPVALVTQAQGDLVTQVQGEQAQRAQQSASDRSKHRSRLTIRSSRNCFAPATAWQRKLATPSPALRSSA